ncbi:MAG: thiamine ABC transporter substrate-binding protein [Chloroflexi bacterium]|jgi:thiamine transport system substrate-binding protein|nr:thiamine ABC transporter substrate-binding protein [Chloroflexota bacterium]
MKRGTILLVILVLLLAACAPAAETESPPVQETPQVENGGERRTLTVMTHDSFAASEEVLQAFEEEHNVDVQILTAGDAGSALNRAILSRGNPLADVFYGVDNSFLSRALDEGIFEPYESPLLADIPDEFELDPTHHALPVDFGDVCFNYDKAYFEEAGLEPPQHIEDLVREEYRSLTVVENPATSSPGLSFLLATIGHFGEDGYLEYWQGLVENDLLVVNDWETAYYGEFTRAGGSRPVVLSYATSPPAEVIFAEQPMDEPPTGVITADGSCFRQVEFVGILEGTQNRDLAERWVDFMLSPTFQEDIPLQMFVIPVNENAELSGVFAEFLITAENPAEVSPEEISANREAWIQAWTDTVLR